MDWMSAVLISFLSKQGYDGASSISGVFKGTRAIVCDKYHKAVYVHCVSHSLNLAISSAAEVYCIPFLILGSVKNF